MNESQQHEGGVPQDGGWTPRQLRILKIAVVVMGVVLVLGFATVIGRIIYLATGQAVKTKPSAETAGLSMPLKAASKLALPTGATIRSLAFSGHRLAVHYDASSGAGIAIFDLASGQVVSQVTVTGPGGK